MNVGFKSSSPEQWYGELMVQLALLLMDDEEKGHREQKLSLGDVLAYIWFL